MSSSTAAIASSKTAVLTELIESCLSARAAGMVGRERVGGSGFLLVEDLLSFDLVRAKFTTADSGLAITKC